MRHSFYGARDWVTPHPRWGVFRPAMIRAASAACSGGAGVTAEVTRPVLAVAMGLLAVGVNAIGRRRDGALGRHRVASLP